MAPSGRFETEAFHRGVAWLGQHYDVRYREDIFENAGLFAGSDERRAEELLEAWRDPETKAIICARGGHGSLRLLPDLRSGLQQEPAKWLVGFSDITVLHSVLWGLGICSIHAHNLTGLARAALQGWDASLRQWRALLEQPVGTHRFTDLETLVPGSARGPLVGGNLTVLTALSAAGQLSLPPNAVLLLEDVHEAPYRLDRCLVALKLAGHLGAISGVVLGQFTHCTTGDGPLDPLTVLLSHFTDRAIPVVSGCPVGHVEESLGVVLGHSAELEAPLQGRATLCF